MRFRSMGLVALISASALALTGCGGGDDDSGDVAPKSETATFAAGSTMEKLSKAGKITIGTKFDQPGFGLVGPDGVPTGFDVEVAKNIAGELGIKDDKIKWVETVSANREQFIKSGQVDLVVATYTINDERKQVIAFAGPYYTAGQSILTLKDNKDIQTDADLDGKKVCTVSGSTPEATLIAKYPKAKVVPFGTYSECLEPLRNGQVDAVSTDNVILAGFAAVNDDLEVRGEPFTEEPYGIGVKKDDTDFRDWINDTLEASFEDDSWVQAWKDTAGDYLPVPDPPKVDRY